VGEAAARGKAEQLAALSMSEQDMQRYVQRRESSRAPRHASTSCASIRIGALWPRREQSVRRPDRQPLDPDAVARRVTELYGRGGLDSLDYHVIGNESRYGLALDARPNSQGPNYLRFGLSLQDDFEGTSTV